MIHNDDDDEDDKIIKEGYEETVITFFGQTSLLCKHTLNQLMMIVYIIVYYCLSFNLP